MLLTIEVASGIDKVKWLMSDESFAISSQGCGQERNQAHLVSVEVGAFIPKSMLPQPEAATIICRVNGKTVAQDATNRMKFSIAEQVADASELTPLKRGDILLTGAGSLGPLAIGDLVEGCIEGLESKYTVSSTLILKAQHKRKAAEAKL
ncbi:unnamed protein product [Cladocopium goreaui]|uniref:Fumarylacetoacetase-like C-terminal domain-containing protein n=1 Tax=Cladocopium goreaui TaxID=2562237 RepID=A0A9P1FII3_9DINO|nr:unnamed protein product [Cladocopium goreaui]